VLNIKKEITDSPFVMMCYFYVIIEVEFISKYDKCPLLLLNRMSTSLEIVEMDQTTQNTYGSGMGSNGVWLCPSGSVQYCAQTHSH